MDARRPSRLALLACLLLLVSLQGISAHEGIGDAPIGFDERLGAYLPLSASFTGEDGATVSLADLVQRPTILVIAYYRCKNECNSLLVGMAAGLRGVSGSPGVDWQVITVSINPDETPKDARDKKALALAAIEKPFPPGAWRFLVGDKANIDLLVEAVGMDYRRNGEDYDHPLGAIVVSPKGMIVRYMNGTDFLPVDLSMSILEASSGLVRPTVAKMLRFCMSYNPASRRFGFDVLRISGIVISIIVGGFVLYLVLGGGRKRRSAQQGGKR
jgi:protein SCO1/2